MSTAAVLILIAVVLVVAVLAVGGWLLARRRNLKQTFGPEYDRVIAQQPNRAAAEQELRDRERKHAELALQPLTPQARAGYAAEWVDVQRHFVDSPRAAVLAGDALLTRLVTEIGYPTGNDDERLALLSVAHAGTLGHYREAHDIAQRTERGEASTEQLRQALTHFRALVAELLGEQPVPPTRDPVPRHPAATAPPATAPPATAPPADSGHNNSVPAVGSP